MNTDMQTSLAEIRQRFFALRNGILADQLRSAGVPHKMIFGLNVPQLAEIARSLTPSMALAEALWLESSREGRLLACYMFPPQEVDYDLALRLMSEVVTPEEADMLAFRLLKRLPFAARLADSEPQMPSPLADYSRRALRRHLD